MKISTVNYGILNLIPFKPSDDSSEEWVYHVQSSRTVDGGEYRFAVSEAPERFKNLSFIVSKSDANYIRQAAFEGVAENWLIPVFEMQKRLPMEAGLFDLRTLFNFSPFGEELSIFLLINNDGTISTQMDYMIGINQNNAGAVITPCEVGFVDGDLSVTSLVGGAASVDLKFSITDLMLPLPSVFAKYEGYDFIDKFFLRFNSDATTRYDAEKYIGTGDASYKVNYGTEWDRAELTFDLRFLAKNVDEVIEFKQFMQSRLGSLVPFWRASFEVQMQPEISGFNVSVGDSSGYLYDAFYEHLVFYNGSEWTPAKIISRSKSNGLTTFVIDKELDGSNYACYFLALQRLANNGMSINWLGNNHAECVTAVTTMVKKGD